MAEVPTAQQIADLRADIGDVSETTFTDSEISRIWARVSGASDEVTQHEAALAMMCRQLMANAAKLVDYTAGATAEKRSQVMKHLQSLYAMYKPSLEAALGTGRAFAKSNLRAKPRQDRTEPGDFSSGYNRPPDWWRR